MSVIVKTDFKTREMGRREVPYLVLLLINPNYPTTPNHAPNISKTFHVFTTYTRDIQYHFNKVQLSPTHFRISLPSEYNTNHSGDKGWSIGTSYHGSENISLLLTETGEKWRKSVGGDSLLDHFDHKFPVHRDDDDMT